MGFEECSLSGLELGLDEEDRKEEFEEGLYKHLLGYVKNKYPERETKMNAKLETIKVDALGNFGVKGNGVWYGTKRPLAVTDFVSGATYTVLVEPWAKGGKSGMNIVQIVDTGASSNMASSATSGISAGSPVFTPNVPVAAPETGKGDSVRRTKNGAEYVKAGFGKPMTDFEIELDARISYAGLLQAAVQSPALAVLPVKSNKDIANAAIEIADALSAAIDKKLEGK